eukprot:SAG22_NODE_1612_length_3998_cov_12.441652_1_plen_62_part_10
MSSKTAIGALSAMGGDMGRGRPTAADRAQRQAEAKISRCGPACGRTQRPGAGRRRCLLVHCA